MRSLLKLGVAAALVVTLAQATPAAAAGPLISQGKPVTASSSESAAFPATAAVDGNLGTRWSSAFSDPQWLQVDLGATYTVDQVTLNWEAAYARAYTIQVSTDATTWSTVYTTTAGAGGNQSLALNASARYVRLNLTTRATQWGYSLWEFQVYGTTGGGPA